MDTITLFAIPAAKTRRRANHKLDATSDPCSPPDEPMTPYQQQLAAEFLPLARALARPLKRMFRQWGDDFESAACMALVEAARAFQPGRNIRFATFARFRIKGALHDVGRAMSHDGWDRTHVKKIPKIQRLTPINEERSSPLNSSRPAAVGAEVDAIDSVERLLRRLPRRNAAVCRLCYLEGQTQTEIARTLGVSQSEVTRLHRQGIELLAEPYGPLGDERPRKARYYSPSCSPRNRSASPACS